MFTSSSGRAHVANVFEASLGGILDASIDRNTLQRSSARVYSRCAGFGESRRHHDRIKSIHLRGRGYSIKTPPARARFCVAPDHDDHAVATLGLLTAALSRGSGSASQSR